MVYKSPKWSLYYVLFNKILLYTLTEHTCIAYYKYIFHNHSIFPLFNNIYTVLTVIPFVAVKELRQIHVQYLS